MHLLSCKILDGDPNQIQIRLERNTNVSDYAILSHRWGRPEDEISFEDMLNGRLKLKKGFRKLKSCCKQALKDGLRYVWVDTCCIDKASSAELSEAITSMFAYYERAKVCYAFLDDVSTDGNAKEEFPDSSFSQSAWFTRGWTLQELIAPTHVKFFDASWNFLGHKTDKWISPIIETVTGVDSIVLNVPATTKLMSIAKKMSWAARRQTTRVEDTAYSLMGIFGVYMPPLYGEGTHAFIRLQEAIMKTSNDQTIFAWTSPPATPIGHGLEHVSTMLALSPSQFQDSSRFEPLSPGEHNKSLTANGCKLDYAITNSGLLIRLPLLKIPSIDGLYAAFLACTEGETRAPSAIFLRTSTDTPPGHFWRTNSNNGPIERSSKRWFDLSGREAVDTQDIYVLPRFTSASKQKIEPAWDKLNTEKDWQGDTQTLISRAESPALVIPTEVLGRLHYVPDPGANQLTFLIQAHQLISTQQGDELVNQVNHWLRFSTAGLPERNKSFCGRSDVLQKLIDTLLPSGREADRRPRVCTLSGPKGLGKTQVAVEFSHHCLENHIFDLVLWINAESRESLIRDFSSIASEFNLVELEASEVAIIAAVRLWLSNLNQHTTFLGGMARSDKWLLVFDHAEDPSLLLPFLPSNGLGCVLVTATHPGIEVTDRRGDIISHNIILQPFTIQQSSDMLRKLTSIDADFTIISTGLAGNPSALTDFAAGAVKYGLFPDELTPWFMSWWYVSDRLIRKRLRDNFPPSSGGKSLASLAWKNVLVGISSSSLAVLQVTSFLDDGVIDLSILHKFTESFPPETRPENILGLGIGKRESRQLWLMTRLVAGSTTRRWMSSILQQVVREEMSPNEFRKALSTAVALVSFFWADVCSREPNNESKSQEDRKWLEEHVRCLRPYKAKMQDLRHGFHTKTEYSRLLKEAGLSSLL